ncbi:hydantoinase/oxoprolinase family protein [Ferrovibrio terrae]|uniref:hydantoinase/oxoprolinase family protein n=1 Tax=Ferrovibrio terrae TaxID=2594003 RepID=UPI003138306B
MKRIGIDVGGTNTDAVLVEDSKVVAAVKAPTTQDVMSGVVDSLQQLLQKAGNRVSGVEAVMIGTTHFVNAVVQRRDLIRVAAIRVSLPASQSLEPMIDWPQDLRETVDPMIFMVEGGHEYDGRIFMPLDEQAVRDAARRIRDAGIRSVGISATFSPLTAEHELRAAEIVREVYPEVAITLSHTLGRIGLLERENVTLLNACLVELGRKTTDAFKAALAGVGIRAPFYLTQNDGTVMLAEVAAQFPVYSFASGPTNSMRGAAFLTRLEDAMVVDVGGTTSDIGCLVHGFPREANNVVEIGGVRTLFRMPDLLSLGLGGGTLINEKPFSVGPRSVGFRLPQEALVFGGTTLTSTDIGVAAGLIDLGDKNRVRHLPRSLVDDALARMRDMLEEGIDRMKTQAEDVTLIAAGGGAFLIPEKLAGVGRVLHVEHSSVANAVGAAIAQVSGEIDQVFSGLSRDEALSQARKLAEQKAVHGGADAGTLKLVEIEDLPIAYLPGNAMRVRARVVGDIADIGAGAAIQAAAG